MSGSRLKAVRMAFLIFAGIVACVAASTIAALSEPMTSVQYRLYHWETDHWTEYCPGMLLPPGGNQPGTNLWKYEYTVSNIGAPQPLREIYTFFNSDNVAMDATLSSAVAPTGWTATAIGPFAPDFNWKERFRTTNSVYYIGVGQVRSGYAVEFTWTKATLPGSQNYDAVYSGGSETYITMSPCPPAATEETTWGGIKALYR
ncbi:MAG: hypothetical protein V1694_06070 [Candidatus Eisenbacteria bacterium]